MIAVDSRIAPSHRALAALALALLTGPLFANDAPPTKPINSIDTIVSDMRKMNDLPLRGYETRTIGWYVGPGWNQMGNDPRTANTAKWFKDAYPQLVNGNPLRAILPWTVLFDGVGHAATNTRVEMRDFRAYYNSKLTGRWVSLGVSPGASGYATPKSDLFGGSVPEDKRVRPDKSIEIKPPADRNYAWHGWWDNGRVPINPYDIAAVFVTLQARLVVDQPNRPDDRSEARLLLQIGADYYIDTKTNWKVPVPAVATSRSKRVTNDWQAFNVMTFSDVGEQDPGGGISEAEFRRHPPPLR